MSSGAASTMNLLECIQMRKWQKAIDIIAADRKVVYQQSHGSGRKIGTNQLSNGGHDTSRLPIHELCKITTSPTRVRFSKDEISDDEEEGEDDDESREDDAAEELDQIFDACELEEGTKMYEVTQFMIDVSHSLGPLRLFSPRDDDDDDDDEDDNDNDNDNNDIGQIDEPQRDIGSNEPIGLENDSDDESGNNVTGRAEDVESSRGRVSGSRKLTVHESILTWSDSMGKTPLHVLCENSCDVNMMRVILGSTREATGNPRSPSALSLILAKDSRGSTPLHYLAYSRQCPFSSLKLMMEYCKPRASYHYDRGGKIIENKKLSPRWIDPTLCTDDDGETPLHWALAGYVSSRRIKELTRYSVDAIMVQNEKGERPFDQFTTNFVDSDWTDHDVCGNEVWENIQGYLRVISDNEMNIKHRSSKKIEIGDHKQRMSGIDDNYCENGCQVKYEEPIELIFKWLPLHFLAGSAYEFPSIFMDFALRYCSDDLPKADANGMLPLHLACGRETKEMTHLMVSKSNNETVYVKRPKDTSTSCPAMKILKKFQRASLTQVPSTKRLPLHMAVDTKKSLSLIAALIRTYPRSLNIPDPVTMLWPYVLAGISHDGKQSVNNESLSVSFALLRADPSVLHLVQKNESITNMTVNERSRSVAYNSNSGYESQTAEESYIQHSSRRIRRLTME